jgi:Pyridoxamine 5'-phosphate oxidase
MLFSATDAGFKLKDGESFRVLDERTVVYLDLPGSGVETIAHVKENERIVLMFCSFAGAPKIVRLHGRGEIIEHQVSADARIGRRTTAGRSTGSKE